MLKNSCLWEFSWNDDNTFVSYHSPERIRQTISKEMIIYLQTEINIEHKHIECDFPLKWDFWWLCSWFGYLLTPGKQLGMTSFLWGFSDSTGRDSQEVDTEMKRDTS